MDFSFSEAKGWSIERLRFELDNLRHELRDKESELRYLEREFNRSPGDWGGSHPIGLDTVPVEMEKIREKIELINNIIRHRL
jgi:hypothetical protein